MKRFPALSKILRWLPGALLALVVVLGIGRLVQLQLDTIYHGQRAPYLQLPSPASMTIRWQSDNDYQGIVHFGTQPDALASQVKENQPGDSHEINLQQLSPLTRYYYRLGSETSTTYGGEDYWFVTFPKTGEPVPLRFWVTGDQGKPGPVQDDVHEAMLAWVEQHPRKGRAYLDLWLTTGDNAYRSGSNKQFQKAFFEPYADILRNVPVWPTYGNHDARRSTFFDIFTFPTRAESGGLASGTEHYFSFDYGQVHFVLLDSQASDLHHDGQMANWLKKDLEASKQTWNVVVFHHPPYSKGTHHSDSPDDSDGRLHQVREQIVPILEQHDVDLVLSGHSHMYERSHFMTCHYGDSSTLKPGMILDRDRKFEKSLVKRANQGTVYTVLGSSAKVDRGALDHPVMDVAKMEAGSIVVDVNGNTLTARFINRAGDVTDKFEIKKSATLKRVTNRAGCE